MVHRTYLGLGSRAAAVQVFDELTPYAEALLELRSECRFGSLDHKAMGVALDGLQTAAYHFTGRPHFFLEVETAFPVRINDNGRLCDRAEAMAAFQALSTYVHQLRRLQDRCRPFGRDYLALAIAVQSLETTAFHFTREGAFYGAKGDSATSAC